ncbi:MAG: DsrE family protein [Pseudomonadota bacterium]
MSAVLVLVRGTPTQDVRAREAAEAALLFSAFTPQLSVLYSGDGVWQLLAGQQPDVIGAVSVASVIAAFPEYDIQRVYADADALAVRGIAPGCLLPGVTLLARDGIARLLATHAPVLTF